MSTTPSPTAGRRRPTGLLWLSRVAWRNPLARGSDRAEAAFGVIVFVLWLLALPIVATAGSMCWPQIAAVADEEQRARHQTTAVLTTEAADFVFSDHGVPMTSQIPVSARWIAPDGSARSGPIDTQSGAKAGDVRTIWVDSTGGVTDPPLTRAKGRLPADPRGSGVLAHAGPSADRGLADRPVLAEPTKARRLGTRLAAHRTGVVRAASLMHSAPRRVHPGDRVDR